MNNPKVDIAIDDVNKGYKVLILLRGAPGTGKSTIARHIVDQTVKGDYKNFIFSTDDFFYNGEGKYVFQPQMLSDAHDYNQLRCRQKATSGWSPIIIDNTNIKVWEMSAYVHIAGQYCYKLEIIEPKNAWCRSAEKLAIKNRHSVTKEKIQRMLDQYEKISVPQLLQINNISCKMSIPQFRRYPPLPLNAIKPATSKQNNTKNHIGSIEHLKKLKNVKQTENPHNWKVNDLLQKEKNAKPFEVNLPKPQRTSPRRTAKNTLPIVYLTEQNYRKPCEEESPNLRTFSLPKPQRQISGYANVPNISHNKLRPADKRMNYIPNSKFEQLNDDSAIASLRKHKPENAKGSESFQLLGQRQPNQQVEDLQYLFRKFNLNNYNNKN